MSWGFKYLARMSVLIVVFMGALHVAWSAIACTAISFYYQERIFDIHRLGGADRRKWMAAYIKSKVSDDQVLAAGSSFTFLYPYDVAYTYTAELNRRGVRTANISATGYGSQGIHDAILCPLIQQNKRPRAIVLELSLINELAGIRDGGTKASIGDCPDVRSEGLFLFTLKHPLGVDWLSIARDQFHGIVPPEKPTLGVVPDSYFPTATDFAKARPLLESNIRRLYARAQSISDNVAMFVTPVYYDGVAVVGRDAGMVHAQFEATLEICKQTAGPNCVDTSRLIAKGNFANMTHFNARGAKALADLIDLKIIR